MQNIIPHLWFDTEALEAVTWYTELFEDSSITDVVTIPDTPSGDAESVEFKLSGLTMNAISAGPYFKFNPSISFMVTCHTRAEVDKLHGAFMQGGSELMPLGEYPFSEHYAWVADRYGLNWQLMYQPEEVPQKIRPVLLFTSDVCGRTEEALSLYASIFKESQLKFVNRYKQGEAPNSKAIINYSEISLLGTEFVLMDNGYEGDYTFNEAISFMIPCKDQEEIDYYHNKLSFVPEAEQCGWVKDTFNVSWQIVPENIGEIYFSGSEEEIQRVTAASLQMHKLDIDTLLKAKAGTL